MHTQTIFQGQLAVHATDEMTALVEFGRLIAARLGTAGQAITSGLLASASLDERMGGDHGVILRAVSNQVTQTVVLTAMLAKPVAWPTSGRAAVNELIAVVLPVAAGDADFARVAEHLTTVIGAYQALIDNASVPGDGWALA